LVLTTRDTLKEAIRNETGDLLAMDAGALSVLRCNHPATAGKGQ
jgi:hypothetical protein